MSDTLRRLIRESDRTPYYYAKESGLQEASMYRFMSVERGVRLKDFDNLCRIVGARLVIDSSPKKGA
ncbi:MAG: hypothetical protein ACYC26_10160 [Phycisphaerales bacterium]